MASVWSSARTVKFEFHFNALLDAIADQKKDIPEDQSLEDKVWEMHNLFLEETQVSFSELENKLLQFHLGNLEFSCAAPLSRVSSLSWDQNEAFPQFSGTTPSFSMGLVKEINYTNNKVILTSSEGKHLTADKVIVTVPLFLLKSGRLKFTPDLPTRKQAAISNLGAGLIEKSFPSMHLSLESNSPAETPCKFLHFSKKREPFFFILRQRLRVPGTQRLNRDPDVVCDTTQDLEFAARPVNLETEVPVSKEISKEELLTLQINLGLILFFSGQANEKSKKASNVLMTVLSGETAVQAQTMSDKEVIPDPQAYLVTNWGRDPHSGMAYSYIPIGTTGEEYDHMACEVDNKLYFAGEATNRHFPQTVTGAYLSGIREAEKIVSWLESDT
ncbi:Lysine-specific histone demethylase 1B [Desmophyllum pertusum]|uniref:Lysine-specific histone demethylase 1B n=1 Tax=Desmophyllum pertusum TaxID=174260 RepID=A0A9W9YJ39_9CNID|nr:Lysine-specific histone demethylase 1B [Desmophyllum pertusum]